MMDRIETREIIDAAKDLIAFETWLKSEYSYVSKPWMRSTKDDLQRRLEGSIGREMVRQRVQREREES